MKAPKFGEVIAAVLVLGALLIVAWAAIWLHSDQALGAAITLVSAGAGFYLRGKVQESREP